MKKTLVFKILSEQVNGPPTRKMHMPCTLEPTAAYRQPLLFITPRGRRTVGFLKFTINPSSMACTNRKAERQPPTQTSYHTRHLASMWEKARLKIFYFRLYHIQTKPPPTKNPLLCKKSPITPLPSSPLPYFIIKVSR